MNKIAKNSTKTFAWSYFYCHPCISGYYQSLPTAAPYGISQGFSEQWWIERSGGSIAGAVASKNNPNQWNVTSGGAITTPPTMTESQMGTYIIHFMKEDGCTPDPPNASAPGASSRIMGVEVVCMTGTISVETHG